MSKKDPNSSEEVARKIAQQKAATKADQKKEAQEAKESEDASSVALIQSDGGVYNRPCPPDSDEEDGATSLWLITFTDAMALMLTFFVMLYAMSSPSNEDWEEIRDGTNRYFGKYESPEWYEGPQDNVDIAKLDFSRALNLNYLSSIISDLQAKHEKLENITLFPQEEHLVISLPEDLLFESGKANVNKAGKQALFIIGGSLANIRNRIEIIGHTDPRPIERKDARSNIETNWELSLRRAMSVADILENVGYSRTIITRGLSSGRYDELPEDWNEAKRLDVSRRVDILIMKDDGSTRKYMEFDS